MSTFPQAFGFLIYRAEFEVWTFGNGYVPFTLTLPPRFQDIVSGVHCLFLKEQTMSLYDLSFALNLIRKSFLDGKFSKVLFRMILVNLRSAMSFEKLDFLKYPILEEAILCLGKMLLEIFPQLLVWGDNINLCCHVVLSYYHITRCVLL